MDFKLPYDNVGFELEPEIRNKYQEGLKKIQSGTGKEAVFFLREMYKWLNSSHPPSGREIEWGADLIKVYRNLEKIFRDIDFEGVMKDELKEKFEERIRTSYADF